LSVAVGGVQFAMAHVSCVVKTILVGQFIRTGLILSVAHELAVAGKTVTVNEQVEVFWLESMAV
jgi:hypothetical protein